MNHDFVTVTTCKLDLKYSSLSALLPALGLMAEKSITGICRRELIFPKPVQVWSFF